MGAAMSPPPRGLREGWGLHLTVFTYDTGRDVPGARPGLPAALPSSPGLEGGGQGPTPQRHFVLRWWGAPGPLPPAAWGFTFTNLEIV